MKRMRGNFVGCQTILWALAFCMVLPMIPVLAGDNVGDSGDNQSRVPSLYFEPIAGLTTTRHLAPSQTAIPVGTALQIFLDAPEDAQVTFSGATVISRNAEGIQAACLLNQVGPVIIEAISELSDGTTHVAVSRLEVVAIAIGDISVTLTTPTVASLDLNENATNEETMSVYFGGSIAQLVETTPSVSEAIGLDGRRRRTGTTSMTRRFRTSISQRINFQADVVPPAFAPLMEWRFDGVGRALGAERSVTFDSVGEHTVSVGPTNRPLGAVIETYSVSITSHVSGEVIVPQGELITFEAATFPPGFEDDITWLSSTKYGTASPVLGYGPTFTVQFDDTFGDDPANGYFEWLGLRADNATFGQDQKPGDGILIGCCEVGACCISGGECVPDTDPSDCLAMDGMYLGEGTSCDAEVCLPVPTHCLYSHPGPYVGDVGCPAGACVGAAPAGKIWVSCGLVVCPATLCPAGPVALAYACPGGPPGRFCRAAGGTSHGCLCP